MLFYVATEAQRGKIKEMSRLQNSSFAGIQNLESRIQNEIRAKIRIYSDS